MLRSARRCTRNARRGIVPRRHRVGLARLHACSARRLLLGRRLAVGIFAVPRAARRAVRTVMVPSLTTPASLSHWARACLPVWDGDADPAGGWRSGGAARTGLPAASTAAASAATRARSTSESLAAHRTGWSCMRVAPAVARSASKPPRSAACVAMASTATAPYAGHRVAPKRTLPESGRNRRAFGTALPCTMAHGEAHL